MTLYKRLDSLLVFYFANPVVKTILEEKLISLLPVLAVQAFIQFTSVVFGAQHLQMARYSFPRLLR